jgi:4-hydroxy-2-oxoheptanedioate aldolase
VPGLSDTCLDPSTTIFQNLNRQGAVIIQIETLEAIHNLDAILTAVGDQIDSVWLGSLDTRVSMEMAAGGLWGEEKEFMDAVALYESILRKHNKPASGLALGTLEMKKSMARGRSLIVTTSDLYSLVGAAMSDLAEVKKDFPAMDYSEVYQPLK